MIEEDEKISTNEIIKIMEHIGSCLEYFSDYFCHREISPPNILWFSDEGYKLADMSISNSLNQNIENEKIQNGASAYNSAAFNEKFKLNRRDFSADELRSEDVFHFGLTLFQAIVGVRQVDLISFRQNDENKFPYKIMKEQIVKQFVNQQQNPYTTQLPDYLG